MKRTMQKTFMAVAVLLAMLPLAVQAAEVTPQTAEQVARTFWNLHRDKDVAELDFPMHRLDTRWDAFYLFVPAEGKGFVIVAADDRVRPVLAYSFRNNAMRDTVGPGMSWWLDGWQQEINELRKERWEKRNEEWQQLLEGDGIPRSLTVVDPLLTTQWDQNAPYNDSCPRHPQNHTLAPTGCVATAMAQVMKYWNYPERGTGINSYNSASFFGLGPYFGIQTANFGATVYDWANMPDHLTMASSDEQKAAVATLMYHCGVACNTQYDLNSNGGSGSYLDNIPWPRASHALNGMIQYFGYSSLATGIRRIKYDSDTWVAFVRDELDAFRPILYTGGAGFVLHCFVCDGYDDENRYHFNWGWGGDGDGFFTLSNLAPGSGGSSNFTQNQQMLVGVQPHSNDDSLCIIRQFPHTEDFETAPTCWEASSSEILYSYSWQIVDSLGVDGNFSAGIFSSFYGESDDHLFSPAIVTPGDYKVVWQARAKKASVTDFYTLTVDTVTFSDTVNTAEWHSRELLFSVAEGDTVRLDFGHASETTSGGVFIDNIVIEKLSGVGIDDFSLIHTINVYPNPTNGHVTIAGMPENGRVELYDATGRLIKVSTSPRINISACPAGVYILRVLSSNEVVTRRIIKR